MTGALVSVLLKLTAMSLLAWLSFYQIAATLYRNGRTEVAPPGFSTAATTVTSNERLLLQPNVNGEQLANIWSAASLSIGRDPLDAMALHQIAAVASERRAAAAQGIFEAAERVSRRDAITQLALIELAVGRDDVPGALRHYDRLLSVHPEFQDRVHTVLAKAASDAEVRKALVTYAGREWYTNFLVTLSRGNSERRQAFELWNATRGRLDERRSAEVRRNLLTTFSDSGDLEILDQLLAPGSRERFTADRFGFVDASVDSRFGKFSWSVPAQGDVQGEIGSGEVRFSVAAAGKGNLLMRTTLLKPGTYVLTQRAAVRSADTPSGEWRLYCGANGTRAQVQTLPVRFAGREELSVAVPEGCSLQSWELYVTAGTYSQSADMRLFDLKLRPL